MATLDNIGVSRDEGSPTRRSGVPSVAIYGGYLVSQEANAELAGRSRYKTFGEVVANTSIVAAAVRHFLNSLGNANWMVEPAKKRSGKQVAKLIQDSLFLHCKTPWARIIKRIVMGRFHGFSLHEWNMKLGPKGKLVLDDVEVRMQHTIVKWDLDLQSGAVLGVVQESPITGVEVYIPRQKLVYFVDDAMTASPEGLGLFRHVVNRSKALRIFEELEVRGYENDLRGIPVGRAPIAAMIAAGMSDAEITKQLSAMQDFLQRHRRTPDLALLLDSMTYESQDGTGVPSAVKQWDIDLLKTNSMQGHEHVAVAIERLNREIARVLGAESLLTGETGSGSLAMSLDKSQNFALIVASALKEIAEIVNRDLVTPLMQMNGIDESLRPIVKPDAVQHRTITEITTALKDLAQTNLGPTDPVIVKLFDMMGLPAPLTALSMPKPAPGEAKPGAEKPKAESAKPAKKAK